MTSLTLPTRRVPADSDSALVPSPVGGSGFPGAPVAATLAPMSLGSLRWCGLLLLVAAASACQKGSDRECDRFYDSCPVGEVCDLATNQCVAADCGACPTDKPVCDTNTNLCVACVGDAPTDDCPNHERCDKNLCVSCSDDNECPAGLCLRNGGCPDAATIAYATAAGTANSECSQATPCTLTAALATGRRFIRVRGDHTVPSALVVNRPVSLYGPLEGARPKITVAAAGPIVSVSGTGTLELRSLELTGATGANGHGIAVTGGTPTIDLETVDVIGNAGLGISAGAATLNVTFGLVIGNAGGGILAGGAVRLENNIIAGNGSASSATGGVRLTAPGTSSVVRFNTVANNQAMTGVGSGVSCAAAQPLSSNIFAGNTMTTCTASYSLFPVGVTVPGTGNRNGDPMFKSTALPANRDDESFYHLADTSPAVGGGEPGTGVSSDIDGDGRISNLEIGADELR